MVIKTALKVRRRSESGSGILCGTVRAEQDGGTPDVMIQVELLVDPSDEIQALPAPMRPDLVGPGVFVTRGKTEWTISLGHSAEDQLRHVELDIEVITETAPGRRSDRHG